MVSGDLGQRCPDCGGLMELNENTSSKGEPMYSLVCRSHGRHTEWYLDRLAVMVAPVIRRRTPHSPPIAGPAPEPVQREVPIQPKSPIPGRKGVSSKRMIEDAMDADGRSEA